MIEIHRMDDWEALYKDGKLIIQTHSIDVDEVLRATGVEYEIVYHDELDADEDFMEFPYDLKELV